MTRDSLLLKFGQAAAIVGALLAAASDPSDYGLSEVAMRWILLICTVVGTLSGHLGNSPLRGEGEPPKDRTVGPRSFVVLLLAAGLSLSACHAVRGPVTPPVTPAVPSGPTEAEIQAVRVKALELATAVESIGQTVVEFRRAVSTAQAAGLVSLDTRDRVNRAVIALEPKAIALIDLAKTVTTQQDLRTVARALMDAVDAVLVPVADVTDSTLARLASAIRTALRVVDVYLASGGGL